MDGVFRSRAYVRSRMLRRFLLDACQFRTGEGTVSCCSRVLFRNIDYCICIYTRDFLSRTHRKAFWRIRPFVAVGTGLPHICHAMLRVSDVERDRSVYN